MEKFIAIVSGLFLAVFVVGIAFFSAPVWILMMPFRFAVAKTDDAVEAGCEPQQGF